MAWIRIPRMVHESILLCFVVIESRDVVEAIGTAILLTVTIAREVSGIVTVIVESVLLGLICLIAIVNGVSVLVMVRSVIVVMGKANFTWVLVAIVTMTVTTPRDGILFGLSFFTNSILLLLFIFGIVIESGMAFEVGMAVVVVMAWADAWSVSMLMIVEGIFLGSLVIKEVSGMGTAEVFMRRAGVAKAMASVARIVVAKLAVTVMNNGVIVIETWIVTTVVAVAIGTGMVTAIRHGATIIKGVFLGLIRLCIFTSLIIIEGRMAFEVGMAVEVVMAWADARSVTVLMIVESIFLGSRIVIEGRMAIVVMGWSVVVMRTAWISRIVFAIITMMFIEGSCSRLFGLSIFSS